MQESLRGALQAERLQGEGPEGSLQQAFQKHLQAKRHRNKKPDDPVLLLARDDPRRMQLLRQRFLARIRKHIGVPYARRHHLPEGCECEGCVEADKQLAQEPLCLDCCGLIRKVAREMADELGFRLGPGNQAYQYDTLPLRVESIFQLEPGDLIFYSGQYFNPSSRRYAFDMTHVEVFIGGETGEATIGSRERLKWVKEYDSYAFASKRWRLTCAYCPLPPRSYAFASKRWQLIRHHYVKIDTWLQGTCEPAHPDMWKKSKVPEAVGSKVNCQKPTWDASKYSIFSGVNVDSGEEASDGDDGEGC